MDRRLYLLQVLEMEVLVKEIAETLDEPSVHFVKIILRNRIPYFRKVQFVINKILEFLDDSGVEKVESLGRYGLHSVELVRERKQTLVRQSREPLPRRGVAESRILQCGCESCCSGFRIIIRESSEKGLELLSAVPQLGQNVPRNRRDSLGKSVPFLKGIQHDLTGLVELRLGIDACRCGQQLQAGIIQKPGSSLAQIGFRVCPLFDQMRIFYGLEPVHSKNRLHQLIDVRRKIILSGDTYGKVQSKIQAFLGLFKELEAHGIGGVVG